jgi:hypothetical protein
MPVHFFIARSGCGSIASASSNPASRDVGEAVSERAGDGDGGIGEGRGRSEPVGGDRAGKIEA